MEGGKRGHSVVLLIEVELPVVEIGHPDGRLLLVTLINKINKLIEENKIYNCFKVKMIDS